MRRCVIVLFGGLVACGHSSGAGDDGDASGSGGSEGVATSESDAATGADGASTGVGGCASDAECDEHEVCDVATGECSCAEGFVACQGECVAEHAATIEVDLDEVIDAAPELGRHFDLALAPDEVPLVVYEMGSFGDLWFARRDAGWSVEQAWPQLDNRLDDAAVAAGPDGAVEIALASFYDGTTSYRSGQAGVDGWAFASMTSLENSALGGIDLAFDARGVAHYMLEFTSSISLQRSVYVTPGPLLSVVPMIAESGNSDLVLDAGGAPQIAYDISGDGFYHARFDGTDWVKTELAMHPINNDFISLDIAVTSTGRARIVAFDDRMDQLLLAREGDDGWDTEVVLTDADLRTVRLSIDADDVEHLVLFDLPGGVMYGRNDGAAWTWQQVGTGTDGRFPLIATHDPTAAHIVYGFDDRANATDDAELRYVRLSIVPLCE